MKQGQLNLSAVHLLVYADAQRKIILLVYNQCYYSTANVLEWLLRAVFRPKTVKLLLSHQMATTASDETA